MANNCQGRSIFDKNINLYATDVPQIHIPKNDFTIFIPTNKYKIESKYYNLQEIIGLLRIYKNKPNYIQFIADMLE